MLEVVLLCMRTRGSVKDAKKTTVALSPNAFLLLLTLFPGELAPGQTN